MLLECRIRVGCSCIDDTKGWLLTCVRSCFVDSKVHVFMYLFCLFRYISAERCTWICSDLQLRHWCMYGRSNISFIQKSSEFVQCDAFYMSKSGFVILIVIISMQFCRQFFCRVWFVKYLGNGLANIQTVGKGLNCRRRS